MIPKERVYTTFSHQEPDIIPWGEHAIDYTIYEMVLGRESFVRAKIKEVKALWEGRREEVVASYKRDLIDLSDALGLDIINVYRAPSKKVKPEPFEQIDKETYRDNEGNLWRIGKYTHDLMIYKVNPESFIPPTVDSLKEEIHNIEKNGVEPEDESVWEIVNYVVEKRGKTHFIALIGAPDLDWPTFGQTAEERMLNLALHPEMIPLIAERNGKKMIASLKNLSHLSGKVDCLVNCADYGTSTGLQANPEIFKKYMFPWHKQYCELAHKMGFKVVKHCCGNIWDILPLLIEAGYDGYESIQASAGMDIKKLKELYGEKLTLWGGVTNENLIGGTPEKVKEDAFYSIKWAAPGGGFIYGASHSLAVGTKYENLMAMKEARDKWGIYPIRI